jgi:hypothetical protein
MPFNTYQALDMHSYINLDLGIKFKVLLFKVGLTRCKGKKKHNKQTLCIGEQTTTNKQGAS